MENTRFKSGNEGSTRTDAVHNIQYSLPLPRSPSHAHTCVLVLPQATNPSLVLAAAASLSWLDEMASGKRLSLTKTSTVVVETSTQSETALSTARQRAASPAGEACNRRRGNQETRACASEGGWLVFAPQTHRRRTLRCPAKGWVKAYKRGTPEALHSICGVTSVLCQTTTPLLLIGLQDVPVSYHTCLPNLLALQHNTWTGPYLIVSSTPHDTNALPPRVTHAHLAPASPETVRELRRRHSAHQPQRHQTRLYATRVTKAVAQEAPAHGRVLWASSGAAVQQQAGGNFVVHLQVQAPCLRGYLCGWS